jgi:glycosyltransferase involved in cell wall biosynthesis
VLFKAFDKVWQSLTPRPSLVFIGDGPEFESLARLRESLESANAIHMLGYRAGAADLLRNASLCVAPSIWEEAFGLAVLEMMARGRAVIATRVGGIPEIIESDVSGVLVPPNDIDSLAAAMTRVLSSEKLQRDLGEQAIFRARLFSFDRQISEMLATFQDVFR